MYTVSQQSRASRLPCQAALLTLLAGCGAPSLPADSISSEETATELTPDSSSTPSPAESGDSRVADSPTQPGEDSEASRPDLSTLDPYQEPAVSLEPWDLEGGEPVTVRYRGSLSESAARLILHYGFDGWNEVEGAELTPQADIGDTAFYAQREMTATEDGFSLTLTLPESARSFQFVFYDPDADVWDNNSGLDYHGEIIFPYIGPYLTWDDEALPEDGVVVSWETSVPCLGVVEYGPTPELGQWARGEQLDTLHHVRLLGLGAEQEIFYRVHDSAGQVSETFSFRTAPEGAAPYRFGVISDMQDGGEGQRWADVAQELEASHGDLDFYLIPGDMVCNDAPGHWWTFFDKGRTLFRSRAMIPAPGNHDTPEVTNNTDTSSFRRYFSLPGAETYYALRYAGSLILALDTNDTAAFAREAGEQYAWAQAQLEAVGSGDARQADRVFVAWHVAAYNAGVRHEGEQGETRDLTELFEGRVNWVFSGHEHLYQRMKPLRFSGTLAPSGRYGLGSEDGVGYIVTPPAGNSPATVIVADGQGSRDLLAWPVPEEGSQEVPSELGFVIVTVEEDRLELETWAMGNLDALQEPRIVDALTVTP